MNLSDFMHEDLILIDLLSDTKEDIIKELIRPIIKTGFTDLVETIRNWRPFGKGKNVDDVIITKAGQVLNTNPNDTIIATQNPGGNNGGSVMNFYGVTPQEMLETMKRQLAVDKNRATRF